MGKNRITRAYIILQERFPVLNYAKDPLHKNALFLIINTGISGILGLTFWISAARLQSAEELGLGSALVSTCSQLALLASLGLDLGLVRFLPDFQTKRADLINAALTLTGICGILVGLLFVIGSPLWGPALQSALHNPSYFLPFIGLVVGILLFSMTNSTFVGLRRSSNVLIISTTAGIFRISFLFVFGALLRSLGIILAWGISLWSVVALASFFLTPRQIPGYKPIPKFDWKSLKPLASQSTMNYIAHLLFNSQVHLVPLIIISLIGPESNAYYFSALALASPTWVIPLQVSMVVVVEGAHNTKNLASIIRRGLAIAVLVNIPILALLWFGGPFLLLAFGERYSEEGLQTLRILAVTGFPVVLIDFYLSIGRVQKKMLGPVTLLASVAAATLIGTYLATPHWGILGAGLALLLANSAGGLIALGKMTTLKWSTN